MKMEKDLAHILKRFSQYYGSPLFSPSIPEIEKREFGAGIEKKIDSRHMGFGSDSEFRSFLVNSTPLYVSHSVAYYQLPKATPMERKGWEGADLVFDLDFETESKYLSRADFERIRADTVRLIEEFIIPDFGVPEGMISANFSGNRGFHVHVRDPRFRPLKGEERREIIEYIKGAGLRYEAFFSQQEAGQSAGRTVYQERGPIPSGTGYTGRFAKKALQILEEEPERLSRTLKDEGKRQNFMKGIKSGNWSMRKLTESMDRKLREMAETELPLRTVNIDAGVTQDASKLIRAANTIHGSTGLSAKCLALRDLPGFEPMRGAIVFSEKPVKVLALEDIPEIEMGNRTQEKMAKGSTAELPEYFAFYLRLKGSAKLLV
jgi:DNA primase small subunit